MVRALTGQLLVLGSACAGLIAGCGGDGGREDTAGPATATPAVTATTSALPPEVAATTPPVAASAAARPTGDERVPSPSSQDFSAPPAARGGDIPRLSAREGLRLTAPRSADAAWTLQAKSADNDIVCVQISSESVSDPDPLCSSGTQLAVRFFSDQSEGHAFADVDAVARGPREAPTELVVSGLAAPNVRSVVVAYRGREHRAQVTRQAIDLPVDKELARTILDPTPEQLRTLPGTVSVRAFAATLPAGQSAPPTTATARTLTPVGGRMVFDLS